MPDRTLSDEALGAALFAGLGEGVRAQVLEAAAIKSYDRDQRLFTQGDPADSFFLVDSGSIKLVQSTPDGKEMIVRFIRPGEVIAAVALLPGGRYPVTALAAGPSRLAVWSSGRIRELVQRHPTLQANIMSAMAMHMQDALSQGRELATSRVPQRLAAMLLRLADRGSTTVSDGVLVDQALSREEMAEMVGTTRPRISLFMQRFHHLGLIETNQDRFFIIKEKKLTDYLAQIA